MFKSRNKEGKEGIAERTIPIFRALTNSTYGEKRHRFHAQLGYALKDQTNPQWKEAKESLEKAIYLWKEEKKEKEENKSDSLPPYYCFNWLICMSEIANKQEEEKYDDQMICEALLAIRNCPPLSRIWEDLEIRIPRGSMIVR